MHAKGGAKRLKQTEPLLETVPAIYLPQYDDPSHAPPPHTAPSARADEKAVRTLRVQSAAARSASSPDSHRSRQFKVFEVDEVFEVFEAKIHGNNSRSLKSMRSLRSLRLKFMAIIQGL